MWARLRATAIAVAVTVSVAGAEWGGNDGGDGLLTMTYECTAQSAVPRYKIAASSLYCM